MTSIIQTGSRDRSHRIKQAREHAYFLQVCVEADRWNKGKTRTRSNPNAFSAGYQFAANGNLKIDLEFLHETYNKLEAGTLSDDDCLTRLNKLLVMFNRVFDFSLNKKDSNPKSLLSDFITKVKKSNYIDMTLGHPTDNQNKNCAFVAGMTNFYRTMRLVFDYGYECAEKGKNWEEVSICGNIFSLPVNVADIFTKLGFAETIDILSYEDKKEAERIINMITDMCLNGYKFYSSKIEYINYLYSKAVDTGSRVISYGFGERYEPICILPDLTASLGENYYRAGFRFKDLPDNDLLRQEYAVVVSLRLSSYHQGFMYFLDGNSECKSYSKVDFYDEFLCGFNDAKVLAGKINFKSDNQLRLFSYGMMFSMLGDDNASYLGNDIADSPIFKKGLNRETIINKAKGR